MLLFKYGHQILFLTPLLMLQQVTELLDLGGRARYHLQPLKFVFHLLQQVYKYEFIVRNKIDHGLRQRSTSKVQTIDEIFIIHFI